MRMRVVVVVVVWMENIIICNIYKLYNFYSYFYSWGVKIFNNFFFN